MRKSDEVQGRRSDIQDSFEEYFTNIRELGSDYKQKIAECDKILKEFALRREDRIQEKVNQAWIDKGINLRMDGRAAESLQCFDNVLLTDKKNARALKNKGMSYQRLMKFHEAIKWFKDALDIAGKDIHILNEIGYCYCVRQIADYDTAIPYFDQVLDIDKKKSYSIK